MSQSRAHPVHSTAELPVSESTLADDLPYRGRVLPVLPIERLVGFVRFLRGNDFAIGVAEELDVMRLADQGALLHNQHLFWGMRAILCSGADEWKRFTDLFDAYWRKPNRTTQVRSSPGKNMQQQDRALGQDGNRGNISSAAEQTGEGEDSNNEGGASQGGASYSAVNQTTDFRMLTNDQDQRDMEQLIQRMARRIRKVMARRQRLAKQGRRLHLRQTMRNSLRYGGMPLKLAYRQSRRTLPRLVMILDVSRSMSIYSTFFLRFARSLVAAFKHADVFVYHTHLVQVTGALIESDTVRMQEKLTLMSQGWSGGTRIGDCLNEFNQGYGRRLVNSRTQVIIVSDGYDTGDPDALAGALQQIQKRAKKLIWLNPLLGRDSYEPIAQGMQAALPYLDLFAPAHNLKSLLALEGVLMK